jgi:hypothetical protein
MLDNNSSLIIKTILNICKSFSTWLFVVVSPLVEQLVNLHLVTN